MTSPRNSARPHSGARTGNSANSDARRGAGRSGAGRSGAGRSDARSAGGSTTFYSSGSFPSNGSSAGSMFSPGAFSAGIPDTTGRSSQGNPPAAARTTRPRRAQPRTEQTRNDHSTPLERVAPSTGFQVEDERPGAARRGRGGSTTAGSKRPSVAIQSTPDETAGSLFALTTTVTADAAPLADVTFAELGVLDKLIAPLAKLGAISPFPIQAATLPVSLTGRDVLGRGRTGSGKTIAFAVPLVTKLAGGRRTPNRPRGLVVLPTRELALQVQRTIEPLAAALGLKTVTIFGGVGQGNQTAALRAGVDIVIACPGRLEDLMRQGFCNLADVEVTVLDEADHMADLGFLPGVRRILKATRPNGQRLLFSATLDNGISVLVKDFLTDPAVHAVDDVSSHIETMTHHVFAVSKDDRSEVIRQLAIGGGRRMLFTRTKFGAKKWAAALSKNGIPAVDLHGNLSQNARERNLAAFSSGSAKVLVATDIAARGIHVDDVELVVHLDPPTEHKAYLHRSGRTARAGAGGTVITVMLPEQTEDVRKLMKLAGISATTVAVRPGSPAIGQLAG